MMAKSHGKWVPMLELEGTLRRCEGVKEAAVIHTPQGFVFFTAMEGKPEASAPFRIRRYCLSHMMLHELPKRIICLTELPKTRTGKIDRARLKETATEEMLQGGKDG